MTIVSTFVRNTKLIITTGRGVSWRTGSVITRLRGHAVALQTDLSRETLFIAIATDDLAKIAKECKELNILADILPTLLCRPTLSISSAG